MLLLSSIKNVLLFAPKQLKWQKSEPGLNFQRVEIKKLIRLVNLPGPTLLRWTGSVGLRSLETKKYIKLSAFNNTKI